MITITNSNDLKQLIEGNFITVAIFTTKTCNVCKPLKEKIKAQLEPFEQVQLCDLYIEEIPAVKGEYQVYTAPIVLLFVDGREIKRYGAAINIPEFTETIKRYYAFL